MKTEDSLPHSQELATCPYLSHISCPRPPQPYFLKIHFNIIFSSPPTSTKWFLPTDFPAKLCMHLSSPIRATYAAQFVLPDSITRLIAGERNRLNSFVLPSADI